MFAKLLIILTNTVEKKRVLSNVFSLGSLQAANYLFPLIIAPYLIRVLGPEYYGLIAFSTATVTYFGLLTDYGFNLSATSQIALHRHDLHKLNEIFSAVMIVKFFLMLLSLILLILLVNSFNKFAEHSALYLITFTMVIGQFLFPVWLFQGMETMKYITYINLLTKAAFTLSIFIFVQSENDYLYVPLFTGIGAIISGIYALYFVRHKFGIRFSIQPFSLVKIQLIDGWHLFLSTIVMSLYTVSTTFILGLLTNNTVVGYFAAADKIILAAKGLFTPVIQALYPMLITKIQHDKPSATQWIKKVTVGMAAYTSIISLALLCFAQEIVMLLFGQAYTESVPLLKIMAFLPFFIGLSNVFGLLVMINYGFKKQFTAILTLSAILGLGLSLYFVPIFESRASASIIVVVEAIVTFIMWLFIRNKKLIRFNPIL